MRTDPKTAFLQSILESPQDDTPRLVFADWLEEHGSQEADRARAEFIRLQCRLARVEEYSAERLELEDSADNLLAEHGAAWRRQLPRELRPLSLEFRRGFPASWTSTPGALETLAAKVCAATPLEALQVWNLETVLDRPLLDWLSELTFWDSDVSSDQLVSLLTSPRLGGLRKLILACDPYSNTSLTEEVLLALSGSPHLSNLTSLTLAGSSGGLEGARLLLTSPYLSRLRSLGLHSHFPRGEVVGLAGLPQLANLTALDLGSNAVGPVGTAALAASPHLANLRHLGLAWAELDAASVTALAGSPALRHLWSLNLGRNNLFAEGGRALLQPGSWDELTHLDLTWAIFDAGPAVFTSPLPFPQLRRLHLTGNRLTGAAVEAMGGFADMPHLRRLILAHNSLGDRGAEILAGNPDLANLHTLDLTYNSLGPAGSRALARSGHLANLRFLRLHGNPIRDEGALALADSPHLQNLVELRASACRLTPTGKKALRGRFGKRVSL